LVLGTVTYSEVGGAKTEPSVGGLTGADFWVIRTNSIGTVLWDKTLGTTLENWGGKVFQDCFGRYIVSGSSGPISNASPVYIIASDVVCNNPTWCQSIVPNAGTCGTVPLPVELTSLTGTLNERGDAVIRWSTSSEKANDYFEIQRSTDGFDFRTIAKVNGVGYSDSELQYEFTDDVLSLANEASEQFYYRLKQVDYDGKSEHHGPVNITSKSNNLLQFVSISQGILNINFPLTKRSITSVKIMDAMGRTILSPSIITSDNTLSYSLPGSVSRGIYLIEIIDDLGKTYTSKVVRQ